MTPPGAWCDAARGRIVLTLVHQARRRLFRNELLSQGANAISAALLALILLLLLGTQILGWQWLVLMPLAAIALGILLARRKLPSPYLVAQMIDHRLGLADSLSTAVYFETPSGRRAVSDRIRVLQREAAQRVSESVDIRLAIPYTMPRTAYAMTALFLVASSLFALRYGLSRRLDLTPPLARVVMQSFGFPERTQEARRDLRTPPPKVEDQDEETTLDAEQSLKQEDQAADPSPELPAQAPQSKGEKKSGAEDPSRQQEQAEPSSSEEPDNQSQDQSGTNAAKQGDKAGNNKGSKADASRQDPSAENSSLLSKVKDAMQNLLSRMKPQAGQSGGQQSSQEQNSKQGKGQQNGGKQESAKNGQQQSAGQEAGDQEGQTGDQADNSQDPQGKGTGKNNSQQASKQPGSGVGSQDGDKNIRQAEQLAAMGKISEIIGKRSANISGETTVEVQNTNQVLHTQYTQRGAEHTQGGAEIHRDEVPVGLEGYVEQYFEQVRKQPAPVKK